jgi:hypothetical protein
VSGGDLNSPSPRRRLIRTLLARGLSRLGLRFPVLFLILFCVTVADLLVPDVVPFVDEIVLAVLTTILGLWKDRRGKAGDSVVRSAPRD